MLRFGCHCKKRSDAGGGNFGLVWGAEQGRRCTELSTVGIACSPCSGVQSKGDGAPNYQLSGLPAALDAAMLLSHFSEPVRDRRRVDQGSARSRTCAPLVLDRLYRPRSAPPRGSAGRAHQCGTKPTRGFHPWRDGTVLGVSRPVIAAIVADMLGNPITEVGTWRPRGLFKGITGGALAGRIHASKDWTQALRAFTRPGPPDG